MIQFEIVEKYPDTSTHSRSNRLVRDSKPVNPQPQTAGTTNWVSSSGVNLMNYLGHKISEANFGNDYPYIKTSNPQSNDIQGIMPHYVTDIQVKLEYGGRLPSASIDWDDLMD